MIDGLPCPTCGSRRSTVSDTRPYPDSIYRRRKCLQCNALYSTSEMHAGTIPQELHGQLQSLSETITTFLADKQPYTETSYQFVPRKGMVKR